MVQSDSTSGTLPSTMSRASPSAIAVLPTPASPTYSGLFLRRRQRISIVRSTSSLRPISGSMRPSCARRFRLRGVLLQRAAAFRIALAHRPACLPCPCLLLGDLRQAVRDVVDDVEARDVLAIQQEHGVALLLAEDRDQHVGDADFLLAARLHVEHRPLQHALEAQRRLHLALLAFLQARRGLVDVFLELLLELAQIRAAGAQDLPHLGRVEDGEQQVLDRQVFVTRLTRLVKGVVETIFKLVGQHFVEPLRRLRPLPDVHISGCW